MDSTQAEENQGSARGRYGLRSAAFLVIALCVALLAIAIWPGSTAATQTYNTQTLDKGFNVVQLVVSTQAGNQTYWAYAATTPQQQEEGYMNQTSIGDCDGHSPCIGMAFIFADGSGPCFWMKNTIMPLEQSWIAPNGTVLFTYVGVPQSTAAVCNYGSIVLETLPSQNITVGERISILG